MTQPIDVAYVDIVARDKSLDKLRKDIDKTFDKIDSEIEKDLAHIDKDFDDALDEIDRHFADMAKTAEKNFDEIAQLAEEAAESFEETFDRAVDQTQRHFVQLGDNAHTSFKRIKEKFTQPMAEVFANVNDVVKNVITTLAQLGSGVGSFVSSSPLLVLILALTPAIIALAAALFQLIGLVGVLPAGFGVLLAAIIPLVVAFQNFGDAVGAIADGDVEKIDKALAKLSVSARGVAREIGTALPFLREFQRSLQESFFSRITGAFTRLISVLPAIRSNLGSVVGRIGEFVNALTGMLSAPTTIATLNGLLATTARVVGMLTGPFIRFGDTLFNVIGAGLPFIERFAAAMGRALDAFGKFVNTSIDNGGFDQFVEDAITTVKELIDLVKATGGLLGTLFAGTEDAGHGFIQSLTEMITRLNEFLKTAEGQDVIAALVFAVQALAATLSFSIETMIFFTKTFKMMLKFFELVGRGAVDFVIMVGEAFGKIPELISTTVGAIPGLITGFFTMLFDNVLMVIGIGVGSILFIFQELPNQIAGFLLSLPQRIYAIFLQIGPLIGDALQGAVDFGRNIIVNGFNNIVDFVMSVPERLKSLIPTFGGAGKNLIQSFMNGFRSVDNFIGDVAGDIVGAVKGFLNRAIDKINVGIAKVDEVLPGDLGRIPRLASGAFVRRRPGGIIANVGEGPEDEWVLPQSKLEAMTGGTTITFGPGAISVNFSGALPTEKEARQIGETIGQGLANAIARRDLRAAVRAI